MIPEQLIGLAQDARQRAYAPYSRFAVGAALLGRSGRVYAACNVENVSYGLSICAERAAVFKAVSEGEREFEALAVVTSCGGPPCGACRQVLAEFNYQMPVYVADAEGRYRTFTVEELLPGAFMPEDLPR
ncbi:MAG: cytidine deaminase [Chloroflexi bacterium]|nr:cytidine deaminase [Chloroflexota bacterium]